MDIRYYEQALDRDLTEIVVIARQDGRWLLCRPGGEEPWRFPAGPRKPGEDVHESARRLLWELTGTTDAQVEAVARAAGCDEFIRGLEQGYDTMVGGGGAHLSGGERQRIAIARAMLKDAPVVILDEATAYIDPENEAIIQQAVARLVKRKTVIVIAHRLSTITDADQIFVIEKGRIAAKGTHKELLDSSGLYREMWSAHMGAKDGETV